MSEYKLKTGKIGKAVVEGYKKIEGAFVETFLEKVDESEPAGASACEKDTEGGGEEAQ